MTHPHLLHARRALWDLALLLPQLAERAYAEQRARDAHRHADADGLRSANWGGGGGGSGHGDPVSAVALDLIEPRPWTNPWRVKHESATATMDWLADRILGNRWCLDPGHSRLLQGLAELAPSTAAEVALWTDDHVTRIRAVLDAPAAAIVVTGVSCPACAVRLLYGHVSGPRDAWTITCRPDCLCTGETCPCGMDQPTAGVAHIWHAGRWQDQLDRARAEIGAA